MRLTLPNGETRIHVSLMRPDRKLLAGCDRDKFYDLITVVGVSFFAFHTWQGVLFAVVIGGLGFPLLRWIGSKQPHFFPIYQRAYNQQPIYRRSSHGRAAVRPRVRKPKGSVW